VFLPSLSAERLSAAVHIRQNNLLSTGTPISSHLTKFIAVLNVIIFILILKICRAHKLSVSWQNHWQSRRRRRYELDITHSMQ